MRPIMKRSILYLLPLLLTGCGNEPSYDATGTFEATEITLSAEANGRPVTAARPNRP